MQIFFKDYPIIFLEQGNKIKFLLASFSYFLEILWKNVLLTKYYTYNIKTVKIPLYYKKSN